MRAVLITVSLFVSLLWAATAGAQLLFFNDSSGNAGTIISPGDGSLSFYNDSRGTTGTIITPGGFDGNSLSFYNFTSPGGGTTSGTIQSFGGFDRPVAPIVPVPAPRQAPLPYPGYGTSRTPWAR